MHIPQSFQAPPRPIAGILEITPYVGGKGGDDGAANLVKLSANENALGASEQAKKAYINAAGGLHRYPEGGSRRLRAAIAACFGLDEANIVCGAGSDELIGLLAKAYAGPGDEVLYSAHGFLMYRLSALAAGAYPRTAPERALRADVDRLLARQTSRTRIVFIANPNNPTGSYLTKDELIALRAGLRSDILLVIDGAYAEFVDEPDYESGLMLAQSYNNVVATRTFSKIHGLAALRLGWMYAHASIVDVINRVRGPFNVSIAAQEAGLAAICDQRHVARSKQHNNQWLAWLKAEIEALGFHVYPSVGNFLLVRFAQDDGRTAVLASAHVESCGIIARDVAAYGLADCLRVTVGTEEENRRVIEALRSFAG